MLKLSINTFVNVAGETVSQVFAGGLPITRELSEERATASAWDSFQRAYPGATLSTWDGRTDETVELARK